MSVNKEEEADVDDVSTEEKLRLLFKKKYADNIKNDVYDKRDVEKFNSDDNFTFAYIRNVAALDGALLLVHDSFVFRKEFDINDLTEDSFDQWVWEKGGAYYHNRDKDGHKILYVRVKLHQKKEVHLLRLTKQFIAYWLEQSFKEDPNEKITILLDMDGAGLANLDMELIKFIINCFKFYFPKMLGYMIIYEMTWLFNAAWKIIKQWLEEEAVAKIKFCKKADIQMFISVDQLMEHMGGTDQYEYKYVPPGSEAEVSTPTDTAEKRRVTFSEQEPTVYKSFSNDSLKDEVSPSKHRTKPSLKTGPSTHKKRTLRDGNSYQGRLLSIKPSDELEFIVDESGRNDKETNDTIALTNSLPYPIAYKVKTTSPEKYRVRPSTGIVGPGSCIEVNVQLLPGYGVSASKDKFLIMAVEVNDEEISDSVNDIWKNGPKESVMEHRLKCVTVKTGTESQEVEVGRKSDATFSSQVTALSETVHRLERKILVLMVLQFVILFILVLSFMRQTQSSAPDLTRYRNDDPAYSTCSDKL